MSIPASRLASWKRREPEKCECHLDDDRSEHRIPQWTDREAPECSRMPGHAIAVAGRTVVMVYKLCVQTHGLMG